MWLSGARVTVAGVEDGRPGLWSGMLNREGVPTAWSQIRVPPVSVPDLLRVVGTSNGDAALIVLIGKESSEVWRS
jgi:hypothetical protein